MNEERRGPGRPNKYESGKMIMRSFRLPEELIQATSQKAAKEGKAVSEVVRELLTKYTKGYKA